MYEVKSVLYNDGEDEDCFALVAKDHGGSLCDLIVFTAQGVSSAVSKVPLREKSDYTAEGGGRTWHL